MGLSPILSLKCKEINKNTPTILSSASKNTEEENINFELEDVLENIRILLHYIRKIRKKRMKKYWIEKLKDEQKTLNDLWELTLVNWKKIDEDIENMYHLGIPLNINAFICRRIMEQTYLAHKENSNFENKYKNIRVRILKEGNPSFYKDIESMQYNDFFRNKIESSIDLYEACNYIIHERGSSYADDMFSYSEDGIKDIKDVKQTSIYYNVETHNLRKNNNYPEKISWFVQYSNEKDGSVAIDMKSLIKAFCNFTVIYEN